MGEGQVAARGTRTAGPAALQISAQLREGGFKKELAPSNNYYLFIEPDSLRYLLLCYVAVAHEVQQEILGSVCLGILLVRRVPASLREGCVKKRSVSRDRSTGRSSPDKDIPGP